MSIHMENMKRMRAVTGRNVVMKAVRRRIKERQKSETTNIQMTVMKAVIFVVI